MKTILSLTTFLALTIAPCFAITFPSTYFDATGSTPGDVVGDPAKFDIHKLTFSNFDTTTNKLTIDIDFNYGGGFSSGAFQPFSVAGVTLNVGDLFFSAGSDKFAVAMSSHSGLTQGTLYKITSSLDAQTVLNHPSFGYRPTQEVWASNVGATVVGTGTVTATNLGGYEYDAKIVVNTNALFRASLNSDFTVEFESATRGNDVLTANVSASAPTPEPASLGMMAAGLVGLFVVSKRRA